jgi:hypothetical protein
MQLFMPGKAISITHSVCVRSLSYPACNAHVPCFHLWIVRLYNIFPHYRINGTISLKNYRTYVLYIEFSTTFVWNISHSKRKWAGCDQKCLFVFMSSTRYSRQILMKVECSRQISDKLSNISFHKNSCSRSRALPYGRTDKHGETNSCFTQFCVGA